MEDVAHLEAPARVDRLAPDEEVLSHLLRLQRADDFLVPAHEELGVLRLLHQERREVHGPVEPAKSLGRCEHRDELVRDVLLAGEEADGDPEQTSSLVVVDPLPVPGVLGEVEVFDAPELPDRLFVLPVDGPLDRLASELKLLDDARIDSHALILRRENASMALLVWEDVTWPPFVAGLEEFRKHFPRAATAPDPRAENAAEVVAVLNGWACRLSTERAPDALNDWLRAHAAELEELEALAIVRPHVPDRAGQLGDLHDDLIRHMQANGISNMGPAAA